MDSESNSKLQMQPNFSPGDGNEEHHRLDLNVERIINQSADKHVLLSRDRSSSRASLVIKDEEGGVTHEAYEDLQRSCSALDTSTSADFSKAKKKQLRRNIALNNASLTTQSTAKMADLDRIK